MAITNFPGGVSSFGLPLLGSGPILTTGKVFFVSSGSGNAGYSGLSPDDPLATVEQALAKCTANKGDVIIAMPGHAEAVASAAAIDLDIAGVSLIGLGSGSLRPTFTMGTVVGASFKVSAANVTVANVVFAGGIDALTGPLNITAADCKLLNIETKDVTGEATDFILTSAAANRLEIDGWRHDGAVAAGPNSALAIVGGDRIVVKNFKIDGNFAVSAIDIRTTATTDLEVHDGFVRNRNAADICIKDTITASTGNIGPNLYFRLADNAANVTESVTGATFVQHQPISVVNLAGEIGMQINTTVSTDA